MQRALSQSSLHDATPGSPRLTLSGNARSCGRTPENDPLSFFNPLHHTHTVWRTRRLCACALVSLRLQAWEEPGLRASALAGVWGLSVPAVTPLVRGPRRRSRPPAPPATRSQPAIGGGAGAVLGRLGQRPPGGRWGQCCGHRRAQLSERSVRLWDRQAVSPGRPSPLPWASSRVSWESRPAPAPFIPWTPAESWQSDTLDHYGDRGESVHMCSVSEAAAGQEHTLPLVNINRGKCKHV
ncbi:uncharacterized protein LOC118588320 [Onychomys torridus]|uniref:uncharacterized protein LOC118588320 n=1 Tax=Onychomys torridus TaxID=38674 RepID=UPI00167F31F8|nr:uncharacterized protein LOC118588320 [Onychomys torridus]